MPRIQKNMKLEDFINSSLYSGNAVSKIYLAAYFGDFGTVRKMVKAGSDLNHPETKHGITPIFSAVCARNVRMIEELVRLGADPNFVGADRRTPLLTAVSLGDVDVVRALLDNGANVHTKFAAHASMLHMAAACGKVKICQLFIERGVDINIENSKEDTPLHYAIKKGESGAAKFLLEKGANPNAGARNPAKKDQEDFEVGGNITPLFLVSVTENLTILHALIKAGADVNVKTTGEHTALHRAVQEGHVETVKVLLRAGADVNVRTNEGHTPLFIAAKYGNLAIVEILLSVPGIDIDLCTKKNSTPLVMATGTGRLDIAKLLVSKGAQVNVRAYDMVTPLHVALMEKKEDIALFLIEKGADIHAVDKFNYTPLHFACEEGLLHIVKALIKKGADISVKNDQKSSMALHSAIKNDHANVVKYLIDQAGADPNAVREDDKTALHYAAACGSVKAVKVLVKKAKIDTCCTDHSTPLQSAVYHGHQEIVKILINNGANVNLISQVDTHPTALHVAAGLGRFEIAKLLLRHNAAVDVREMGNGNTPLFLATEEKHEELVTLLVENGADVNVTNKFGELPIHVAAHAANIKMVEVLLASGSYYNLEARSGICCRGLPEKLACKAGNSKLVTLVELIKNLFDAVIKNDTQEIKCCIQAGAIVNARNSSGRTALHYAVSKNNIKAVKVLLENKANATYTTHKGNSSLHIAVANRCVEIVEILLEHAKSLGSAKCNQLINAKVTEGGSSALHIAAKNNDFSIVKLLIQNGAVHNAVNKSGKTPLDLTSSEEIKSLLNRTKQFLETVIKGKSPDEVKQLLQVDPTVINARDVDGGGTPLYWAISKGFNDIANVLLSNDANVRLVTNKGSTPLHIAASKGNTEMVKVLIERSKGNVRKKCDDFINMATNSGTTALHVTSNLEVAELLLHAGAVYNIRNGENQTAEELTKSNDVLKLLETTHQLFESVGKGDSTVIKTLNSLKDGELKAVTGTKNEQGLTLRQVALAGAHVKIGAKILEKGG